MRIWQKKKNLIVYIVPEKKRVNGGIMSIFSQCKESRRFRRIHKSEVILCTYPGKSSYGHNDLFENEEMVYDFDEVIEKWPELNRLLLHIPECAVTLVNKNLQESYMNYLNSVKDLRINVMTQNIQLLPAKTEFAKLFKITPRITQTTAHDRYTTQKLSDEYDTPVHHLSTFVDQSQYEYLPFEKKENLIIYSPDKSPYKERVLKSLGTLSGFRLQEVRDLSYDQYKQLTASAKFSVTFGEGYDGYFIESYLSGSVGLAVYNDDFFPSKDYLELASVFKNYDEMIKKIPAKITELNNKKAFGQTSALGLQKINKLYSFDSYLAKLKNFYLGRYDIRPRN